MVEKKDVTLKLLRMPQQGLVGQYFLLGLKKVVEFPVAWRSPWSSVIIQICTRPQANLRTVHNDRRVLLLSNKR
jgi:hypothetical protein